MTLVTVWIKKKIPCRENAFQLKQSTPTIKNIDNALWRHSEKKSKVFGN